MLRMLGREVHSNYGPTADTGGLGRTEVVEQRALVPEEHTRTGDRRLPVAQRFERGGEGRGRPEGVDAEGRSHDCGDPSGGQRWVVYDEAWRLMSHPALLRRMDAQWRLARHYGIANMLIFHKLTDLDNVGDSGSAMRALASSLLANAETQLAAQYGAEARRFGEQPAWPGASACSRLVKRRRSRRNARSAAGFRACEKLRALELHQAGRLGPIRVGP